MQIVRNNIYIAVSFITKLSNYPVVGDYFEAFLEPPVTINSIDVFSRIHKFIKVPQEITLLFALLMMKDIKLRPDNDKDKNKMVKISAQFFKAFMKNNALDFKNYEDELEDFINSFLNIEEVVGLKKFLQGQKD